MENYTKTKSIKNWAEGDRPREKLIEKGKSVLTDVELLAIIIGSGTPTESAVELARRILHSVGNNLHALARLNMMELTKFKGIGEAKAISVVAAMELGRRYRVSQNKQNVQIKSSKDAYELVFALLSDLRQEVFYAILLNQASEVISIEKISEGTSNSTTVDIKEILTTALLKHANGIILCHNHPSGHPKPSQRDLNITNQVILSAKMMQIQTLDHIIIGQNTYYSFMDEGLMEPLAKPNLHDNFELLNNFE